MQIELDREELLYTGRIDLHDPKHPEWVFPATAVLPAPVVKTLCFSPER